MQIRVIKDGEQLGPYTIEQVNAEASAGGVTADDLAWIEGWSKWQPLSMVPGFIPASLTPGQRASMFSAFSQPPLPPPPIPPAPVRPSQKNATPEEPKPALKTSKSANWVSFFAAVVIMTVIWALTDYKLPWWLGFIAVLIIQGVLLTAWNRTKKKK